MLDRINKLTEALGAVKAKMEADIKAVNKRRQARSRKVNRNDLCGCGSGLKIKKCCGALTLLK